MARTTNPALAEAILSKLRQQPGLASAALRVGLAGIAEVPRQTLTRYLSQLIRTGAVWSQGQGAATRYFAADLPAYFAVAAEQRPTARFDIARVSKGLPRFTTTQLKRLHAAAQLPVSTVEDITRAVREQLLIELSWASSRLEGNTYSLLETQALIEYGQEAQGKAWEETRMILNHRDAIRHLLDHAGTLPLDYTTLRDLHALLSDGLLGNPADSGRIRQRKVFIGHSAYQPLDNQYQLREAVDQLFASVQAEADPFNRALMLLAGVSYVQPFVDCNKRTGRVIANLPLLQARCPPLSFVSVDKQGYLEGLIAYYELGIGQVLADTFERGYLKSAEAYRQLMQGGAQDTGLRHIEHRYRGFLRDTLRAIVRGERKAVSTLPASIPKADQAEVTALIQRQLDDLHEGRAVVLGVQVQELAEYLAGQKINRAKRAR